VKALGQVGLEEEDSADLIDARAPGCELGKGHAPLPSRTNRNHNGIASDENISSRNIEPRKLTFRIGRILGCASTLIDHPDTFVPRSLIVGLAGCSSQYKQPHEGVPSSVADLGFGTRGASIEGIMTFVSAKQNE